MPNLISHLGHLTREVRFHAKSRSRGEKRCLFFVSDSCEGSSAGLRGVQLAESLRDLGWESDVVPHQLGLASRIRILKRYRPDVVVFQKARHPLNRIEHYSEYPIVFDLDDADYLDPTYTDVIDECARSADATVAGSRVIAEYLKNQSRDVTTIWTGARVMESLPRKQAASDVPSIVWASSSLSGYPAEARFLNEVLTQLAMRRPFRLVLIGKAKEKWVSEFVEPLLQSGIRFDYHGFMRYRDLINRVASCDIGVAPLCPDQSEFSSGKSFGKLLVYLNAGLAIVTSDAADHALAFESGGALVADSVDEWVTCLTKLIDDPASRKELGQQGRSLMAEKLSISACAEQYDRVLQRVIENRSSTK